MRLWAPKQRPVRKTQSWCSAEAKAGGVYWGNTPERNKPHRENLKDPQKVSRKYVVDY